MKFFIPAIFILIVAISCNNENKQEVKGSSPTDTTIVLPEGFSATVFADTLGKTRHIAFNSNGDVYVKLETVKNGRGILRLRDTNNDGVADDISGFGDYGGTGIAIKDGYLYATSDDNVYRYKLGQDGTPDPSGEMIIAGLVNKRQHSGKTIALDNAGNIY